MNYTVYKNGEEIAAFKIEHYAIDFVEKLIEEELMARNSGILDVIAKENDLDRRYPATFPLKISEPYYARERELLKKEFYLKKREN